MDKIICLMNIVILSVWDYQSETKHNSFYNTSVFILNKYTFKSAQKYNFAMFFFTIIKTLQTMLLFLSSLTSSSQKGLLCIDNRIKHPSTLLPIVPTHYIHPLLEIQFLSVEPPRVSSDIGKHSIILIVMQSGLSLFRKHHAMSF